MRTMPSATRPYIRPTRAPLIVNSARNIKSMAALLHRHEREVAAQMPHRTGFVGDAHHKVDLVASVVEGVAPLGVALVEHMAAQFARARLLAVVWIELLVQVDEALDAQGGRLQFVDVAHNAGDEIANLRFLR